MITLAVPVGAGAAGGSLTITEVTSLGRCGYTVPTLPGDTTSIIANNVAALFNSSSNDKLVSRSTKSSRRGRAKPHEKPGKRGLLRQRSGQHSDRGRECDGDHRAERMVTSRWRTKMQ